MNLLASYHRPLFLLLLLTNCVIANATEKKSPPELPPGHINLSAEQIKLAQITVQSAGKTTINESLPLYGRIIFNPERMQAVSARFAGTVRSVTKKTGDTVHEGETLATIESNESLKIYPLTAALNGVVIERHINSGEQTGNNILFTVADVTNLWVELKIFPRDINKIHPGQKVRITNPQTRNTIESEVVLINNAGQTQILTAIAQINNQDNIWKPGLAVNADIILSTAPVAVAVHNEALQELDGHTIIFARNATGFEARTVKIGRHDNQFSEILEGISANEYYAAGNSFILKSELGKGDVEE